jgi:hypothetical protein
MAAVPGSGTGPLAIGVLRVEAVAFGNAAVPGNGMGALAGGIAAAPALEGGTTGKTF